MPPVCKNHTTVLQAYLYGFACCEAAYIFIAAKGGDTTIRRPAGPVNPMNPLNLKNLRPGRAVKPHLRSRRPWG